MISDVLSLFTLISNEMEERKETKKKKRNTIIIITEEARERPSTRTHCQKKISLKVKIFLTVLSATIRANIARP